MEQAERAFLDQDWRRYLGHDFSIRSSTNDVNPCRGHAGYTISNHAIAMDKGQVNLKEFERWRYILFLDEVHHIEDGGVWHRALQPLIDRACLVVPMSGSLGRGDGKRMGVVPYRATVGGETIDMASTEDYAVVRYTRQEALAERAILPLFFSHADARAEWVNRDGEPRSIESFEDAALDGSDALYTALRSEFAFHLLDRELEDWIAHRAVNPRAKNLVVSANISEAKKYIQYLKDHSDLKGRGVRSAIATSDDSKDALQAIKAFKKVGERSAVDILVTVGMAYEGLDVPPVTHIACLTHIRSIYWIEQMLNRATRVDHKAGDWSSQFARAFVPDDYEMRAIILKIQAEQEDVVCERAERAAVSPGPSLFPPSSPSEIAVMGSSLARERSSDLSTGENTGYEETRQIQAVMERHRIAGVSPLQFKRAVLDLGFGHLANGAAEASAGQPILTPTEREKNLLNTIQKRCSLLDVRNGWDHGETNRRVIRQFGKPRGEMSVDELMEVWAWLQRAFPVSEES
jgi:superfamily II DNA or RNA helicase